MLQLRTPDPRFWRIDWFGEVAYPPLSRRRSEPGIHVVMSPLLCDPADGTALCLPTATDLNAQRQFWRPISMLSELMVGDIWQGDEFIASPAYQTATFANLEIGPSSTRFIKAGVPEDEGYLLPFKEHPWHHLHTQSSCVRVHLEHGKRLVIPCQEIIRFYFGSSSNLLRRLFTMPISSEALWRKKTFDQATGHLHLWLAHGLNWHAAADVGRIAQCVQAEKSAKAIYLSCAEATTAGHPAYPRTAFPFVGKTTLTASGLWLPFGDEPNSTFVVFRLNSCSHQFPFKSLGYVLDDCKGSRGGEPNEPEGSSGNRHRQGRQRSKHTELVDADPGRTKTPRVRGRSEMIHFPDLRGKKVQLDVLAALCSKCTRRAPTPSAYFRDFNPRRTPWRIPSLSAALSPNIGNWRA